MSLCARRYATLHGISHGCELIGPSLLLSVPNVGPVLGIVGSAFVRQYKQYGGNEKRGKNNGNISRLKSEIETNALRGVAEGDGGRVFVEVAFPYRNDSTSIVFIAR